MKGGRLRRFRAYQDGGALRRFRAYQDGGAMQDILKDIMRQTWSGAKTGLKRSYNPLKMPKNVVAGAKRGLKRGARVGLEKEITRQASKRLKNIFGE